MRTRPIAGARRPRPRSRSVVAVVAAALVAAAVVLPAASTGEDSAVAAPDLTLSLPRSPEPTDDLPLPPRAVEGVPAGTTPDATTPDGPSADGTTPDGTSPDGSGATWATSTGSARVGNAPTDPAPADPAPADPAPSEPAPAGPAPADPAAAPARPAPVAPRPAPPTEPGAVTPDDAVTPVAPQAPAAPGTVSGTLVRLWAEQHVTEDTDPATVHAVDDGDGTATDQAAASLQAWVETTDRAYQVPPTDVVGVEDGSTVTVELGAAPATEAPYPVERLVQVAPAPQVEGAVTFGEGSTDVFGAAAATVVHDVTVVLAVPKGAVKDSTTRAAVAATVNGGVNTFWSQQSRGQRGVRVVAQHDWQTLARDCSDPMALWSEVAGKVGWTAGARKHLLVYLPSGAGCGAGLGTVGGGPDSGGRSWVSLNSVSIIAHELGHNMGLGHSDGLLCTGRSDGTWSGSSWQSGCATYGYRDYYDVMGVSWSQLGSLAAPHADALGLLRSTEQLVTSQPVRVHLVPASSDGLRVLRVDDPGGAYYVEYRTASGWDAWLSNNYKGLDAGVIVHRRSPSDARKILLLDGSVTTGSRDGDWRSALPAGTSMTTASGVTRLTVESQDAAGATLVVHRNGVGPSTVVPPAGGAQVEIRTPTALAAASGTTVFSGVATAPEGTLMWEVVQGSTVRASGTAQTGANGTFDTFQVPVALPAGTFTFRVWVPDESSGESDVNQSLLQDETTVTLT
ncbi:Gmad2 immunoglobulin-like domain-containing protein [Aquipuribacter sp. MA13-6]|uniref:Gmad2 immunoglobulin-like domain-containing protein n=1 Tax=unclassified Aquipuribacter TaxID=2635084 RepID=UPI003EEEC0CC